MYAGMGTKALGQFCSFLSYQTRLIEPNKYILGFVNVPSEILGRGTLKEKFVKASVRVPKTMHPQIDSGKITGAVNLLDKASEGFGIADGHQYAASVIVPKDKKTSTDRKCRTSDQCLMSECNNLFWFKMAPFALSKTNSFDLPFQFVD